VNESVHRTKDSAGLAPFAFLLLLDERAGPFLAKPGRRLVPIIGMNHAAEPIFGRRRGRCRRGLRHAQSALPRTRARC